MSAPEPSPFEPSRADSDAHAPGQLLMYAEAPRVLGAIGALWATAPWLACAPGGDGHPVLVLPGLMASDVSTVAIRGFLRARGYRAYKWHLGRNIGPTAAVRTQLPRTLEILAERRGARVSLIGWSLGGIYARQLAHERPDCVRQVITLASPYRLRHHSQTRAGATFERYSHLHVWEGDPDQVTGMSPHPLEVPTTSFYSRSDGIVAWQHCIEPTGPHAENIRVMSSHLGVGFDPHVLWAIADRLAQPEGDWRPFRPPAFLRPLFPTPDQPHAESLT